MRSDPLATGFHFEAIVTINDNKWAAFKIKLNPRDVDAAATALKRFAANVDKGRHGEPSALGVITSTGVAGRREDGVHVIPIGCLGP